MNCARAIDSSCSQFLQKKISGAGSLIAESGDKVRGCVCDAALISSEAQLALAHVHKRARRVRHRHHRRSRHRRPEHPVHRAALLESSSTQGAKISLAGEVATALEAFLDTAWANGSPVEVVLAARSTPPSPDAISVDQAHSARTKPVQAKYGKQVLLDAAAACTLATYALFLAHLFALPDPTRPDRPLVSLDVLAQLRDHAFGLLTGDPYANFAVVYFALSDGKFTSLGPFAPTLNARIGPELVAMAQGALSDSRLTDDVLEVIVFTRRVPAAWDWVEDGESCSDLPD